MLVRSGHVIWLIEKACELIGALTTAKKLTFKEEAEVDQMLSDLSGLDKNFFSNANSISILPLMLGSLEDSQKVLVAKLLEIKNPDLYGDLASRLMLKVDWSKVHSKAREFET